MNELMGTIGWRPPKGRDDANSERVTHRFCVTSGDLGRVDMRKVGLDKQRVAIE